ncbi:hypothetical protein B0H10DRAFT_1946875 [Mycena sp. CBHHK59/15]|nr:hypothetical protein B0H10DRAFT_1946875 [Mycena sp. CBHHK59/15]
MGDRVHDQQQQSGARGGKLRPNMEGGGVWKGLKKAFRPYILFLNPNSPLPFFACTGKADAANQFLHTQDLYEVLLTFVVSPQPLNTLARLCKGTSELALDALWYKLCTPTNIICLLPEDVCRLAFPGSGQMREFHGSGGGISVSSEIFSALKTHRHPIFPRLLKLIWHPLTCRNSLTDNSDCLGTFHLLSRGVPKNRLALTMWNPLEISPIKALVKLDPHINADLCHIVACLNQPLATWIPNVPSLELFTGSHLALPNILEGLQNLTQLRNFHVNLSVGPTILMHLAGLPHLLSLHLWEETAHTIRTLDSLVHELHLATFQSFPVLETFSLNPLNIYSSLELDILLPLIASDTLHTRIFSVDNSHLIDFSFLTLFAALHRATQLRHIEIYAKKLHPSQGDVSADVLAPLYSCMTLEFFAFHGTLHIQEADFARMAASWPCLCTLRLLNTQSPAPAPAVHIYALWRLLQPCPHLLTLTMSIDARVTGPFECATLEEQDLRPLHNVGNIMFIESPCTPPDAAPVAAFINKVFPRLSNFGSTVQRGETKAPWVST